LVVRVRQGASDSTRETFIMNSHQHRTTSSFTTHQHVQSRLHTARRSRSACRPHPDPSFPKTCMKFDPHTHTLTPRSLQCIKDQTRPSCRRAPRGLVSQFQSQSVSRHRGPPALHHRLKGRLRSPRSTQVLSTRSLGLLNFASEVGRVSPSTQTPRSDRSDAYLVV